MSDLTLLTWNAYVGNSPRRVRRALKRWVRRYSPAVIVVSEARPFYRVLRDIPGYDVYQERPRRKRRRGPVDDRGDTAILVRSDIPVRRRRVARMAFRWRVFSRNRVHTPRRYEVVKVRIDGRWWKIRGSHWPTNGFGGGNSRAFRESALRSKIWARLCRVPTVDAGDMNETKRRLRKFFGKRFKVVGHHIDVIIARRVRRIAHKILAKKGSNHRGQLYVLTAK